MSLRLTIAGVVLAVIAALGWRVVSLQHQLEDARADIATLADELDEARGQRNEAKSANAEWKRVADERGELLRKQREEIDRVREAGREAVLAAERKTAEANAAFDRFMAQFRARPAPCEVALKALDSACPTLQGY